MVNGELIENDIRLSETIKGRLDEIKYINTKMASIIDKR
jgi:hypothetical protein